ncbi:hypothetical protein LIER_04747 [Lithospermum erythrorhizon]|uniref:Uncharacterized protein n=1 Tax=Lithospermum erythrorhizon TaxID=34254 RepID=A0AAV3NXV2_LITER
MRTLAVNTRPPLFRNQRIRVVLGCSLPPRKRIGSPLDSPRPSQLLKRSKRTPPSSSPADANHAELISSLSALVHKELLSSYEAVSRSSSRAGQLEGELKALKKKKAREEGVLQRHLKNLVSEHTTLQEKGERNSAIRERDVGVNERDNLCAGRDEMLDKRPAAGSTDRKPDLGLSHGSHIGGCSDRRRTRGPGTVL